METLISAMTYFLVVRLTVGQIATFLFTMMDKGIGRDGNNLTLCTNGGQVHFLLGPRGGLQFYLQNYNT